MKLRMDAFKDGVEDEISLFKEEVGEQLTKSASDFNNNIVQFKDDILNELVKMRDDVKIVTGKYSEHEETIEDYEKRISRLEKRTLAA